MTLLVDTSAWSLLLRRDRIPDHPVVGALRIALDEELALTTGLIAQELLQGFAGPKAKEAILRHLRALQYLTSDIDDHLAAAELKNACRRAGIQLGTVDALIAQLCVRHDLTLLTTDHDFSAAAAITGLRVWAP